MTSSVPRNPPLRLCVYTRAWRAAGAGLFAQQLVRAMADAGAAVTFVCPPTEDPALEAPRDHLVRIRPNRERVGQASRVARVAASFGRMAGGAAGLLRARFTNRLFVVSIPDPLPVSLVVLALLRLSGARLIFVAHDPLPHAWRMPPSLRRVEKAVHGACYRLASSVVVLSEPTRTKLAEAFPGLRTPVSVIEHGVFLLAHPTPLPGDGKLLAFGTLRRNKGIVESIGGVIAARAAGVPVRLIVAGAPHPEDRSYADACIALAASAPEAIDLRLGFVPDEALPALFAETDALLMPYSDFFSQSGVALLAASNARPVVAAAGGIGALIAEGMPAVTIATPVSAATVAEAVTSFLATDAATWRERAEAYRAVTLEKRSWSAIARAYLDLAARLGA